MNTLKVLLTLLLLTAGMSQIQAQDLKTDLIRKTDKIKSTPWIVGAGINAMDDAQNFQRQLLNIKTNWKIMPSSRFTIEKHIINGISISLNTAFNKYNESRILADKEVQARIIYTSLNIIAKYDLNKLLGATRWIDPYLLAGLGHTVRNQKINSQIIRQDFQTANLGIGFNLWLTEKCGFNLETASRYSISGGDSKHKQHAFGVIYKIAR